jgi:hypothetical protein
LSVFSFMPPIAGERPVTAPSDNEPAIKSALARVAHELVKIAESLERLETMVAFLARAAAAK